jgi:hypothetical protein
MAARLKKKAVEIITLSNVSQGGNEVISFSEPYTARVTLTGTAALLFHTWNCESVAEKAAASKNSKAKKTDDVQSYVTRNDAGHICIPGEYVRQSIIHAAKFRQDPRSPRKSAMDLFKAGVFAQTELASLGAVDWDYLDRRRVGVQRASVTRERPAFRAGWSATFDLSVLLPEYIAPSVLHDVITAAGKLIGIADYRPTFGRFQVTQFTLMPI